MKDTTTGRSGRDHWESLSPEFDRELRARGRRIALERNEVLCAQGSVANAIYCVEKGMIRLSLTAESGRESVLSVLEVGQWFGEASLFTQSPHSYNMRAVMPTNVIAVPAAHFHEIVDNNPDYLFQLIRLVCGRYKWALQWIDSSILQPFPVRLAQRLMLAERAHARSLRAGNSAFRVSQEDLSQMLGVSRQSVNKQLKDWEEKGILRVEYGRVLLLDRSPLKNLIEGGPKASD